MATILDKRDLTDVTKLFVVDAPLVARNARPGQFVILRVSETGERVPISLSDFDDAAGTITLVVQEVGRTSALVCALEPGDAILDLAGPLGTPAPLPEAGRPVLVGGGFGIGALNPIARALRARGLHVSTILGARTDGLLILRELLGAASDELHLCTDDGSCGFHGLVSSRLEELFEDGAGFTDCFAIGPLPMMRAVSEVTARNGVATLVSLDPIMVDGTGMCGGCRVTVGGHVRFACVDGPFFDGREVDFDQLVVRSKMYAEEEKLACELAGARR